MADGQKYKIGVFEFARYRLYIRKMTATKQQTAPWEKSTKKYKRKKGQLPKHVIFAMVTFEVSSRKFFSLICVTA